MEIPQLKQVMEQNIEKICRELLPNGKRSGKNWHCGSIQGEPGESLSVPLTGKGVGGWCDWSTSEKGDLLTLWRKVRGLNVSEAMAQIKTFLNVYEPAFTRPTKTYNKPVKPLPARNMEVVNFLTNERKLTIETLKAFGVESDGRFYVLPSYRDKELIHWKKISIDLNEKGKKIVTTSEGTEPCLFGWQAMDPNATEVYITEGEIDAMTLHQYGANALSVPFGAGVGDKLNWIENEYPHLDRFAEIYICMDTDVSGQACVLEMANRLGLHRCRSIKLPLKDANECLKAGLSIDDLLPAIANAETFQPGKLKNAGEFRQIIHDSFIENIENKGHPLSFCTKDEFCFRKSEITLWTGINGHGKSLFIGQIMMDLILKGEKFCVASFEMTPRMLFKRLCRQATAMREPSVPYRDKFVDWIMESLWLYDQTGTANTKEMLDTFVYARKRYGVSHFIIDSLMKCGIASDDYKRQKEFVDTLCVFKQQYNCHVHLVAHPKKTESEFVQPDKQAVAGSGSLTDLVDNQVLVFRNKMKMKELDKNKNDESVLSKPDAYITIQKQRNDDGWEGSFPVWFDLESQQFIKYRNANPKRYVNYEGGI